MPVTTTRADSASLSCTAVMMSRSLPKSARVPVTNRISLRLDKVRPANLRVRRQVPGGHPAEYGVVVRCLDLAGAGPFNPGVLRGQRLARGDRRGGDHAGVGEVDGGLFGGQDLLAAAQRGVDQPGPAHQL